MVPWTHVSRPPNAILISFAVFAQLTYVSNTQTTLRAAAASAYM